MTALLKLLYSLFFVVLILTFVLVDKDWAYGVIESTGASPVLVLIGVCIIYSVLLMVPYMPGMEVGLIIMMVFGPMGIVGAWLSTVFGMTMAFFIGTKIKKTAYMQVFITRVNALSQSNPEQGRLRKVLAYWLRLLSISPYLSTAVLINLPGNSLIGGGGGIALTAGALSEMMLMKFVFTIALASAILPTLLLTGMITLG